MKMAYMADILLPNTRLPNDDWTQPLPAGDHRDGHHDHDVLRVPILPLEDGNRLLAIEVLHGAGQPLTAP